MLPEDPGGDRGREGRRGEWAELLRGLRERGLKGVQLFVSDKCLRLVENLADFYLGDFAGCLWKGRDKIVMRSLMTLSGGDPTLLPSAHSCYLHHIHLDLVTSEDIVFSRRPTSAVPKEP